MLKNYSFLVFMLVLLSSIGCTSSRMVFGPNACSPCGIASCDPCGPSACDPVQACEPAAPCEPVGCESGCSVSPKRLERFESFSSCGPCDNPCTNPCANACGPVEQGCGVFGGCGLGLGLGFGDPNGLFAALQHRNCMGCPSCVKMRPFCGVGFRRGMGMGNGAGADEESYITRGPRDFFDPNPNQVRYY